MHDFLFMLQAMTTFSVIVIAFAGVAWGILGGAPPGISPSIAMALLLPITYDMQPLHAIVLLAATYVGAEYGGSIPAILIRTPGTNAAAATTIDGYAMHLQRSEEHTSELQSLMRISYAVFCLKKKKKTEQQKNHTHIG